jgi:cyclophilin family peptidyl-prolyl cis-trans isomerase/HEAT repeat protein
MMDGMSFAATAIINAMRKLLLLIVTAVACTSTHSPAPPGVPSGPAQPYSLSFDEEATVLALEDRRQYDPALVDAWIHHRNPMHRSRITLALGRIGPHTFVDSNGNGERDPAERQAGVDELAALVSDSDSRVRATAAFALGEIGDATGVETLLRYTTDADGDVAAEATEALSKITQHVPLDRYVGLTADNQRESVRARAVRFLFRFGTDEASAVAANLLGSPSAVIRQEAAYALARRAYPPARARLELLMSDANAQTRAYVVRALGGIAATESLNAIVAALGDQHPWVRTNAAVALARIAAKDATILDRAEHAHRVIAVSEDADAGTRASSIDALGFYAKKNEAARKRLLEIAASGTRWDRELAIGAIAKHLADATLLPADLTTWGKVRVLEAANAVSDAARVRYLKDSEAQVRSAALGSIADDKVDANLDAIRAALDDDDPIVRGNAIDRYGKSHDPKRIEILRAAELRARKDQQNDARLSAIRALGEIEDEGREPMLRELLRDDDPVVRRVAADLIEQKLAKRRPQFTPLKANADYRAIVEWSRTPHAATIHMARGRIELALLTQDAPMTTWNFAQLAQKKFFDGTTFMRVVPNFVIQGGDPRNDTEGGPGYAIRDEINLQKYTRGAVGMALSGPDTGGSQYFITHSPQPHLDGGYTIFGRVTGGMTAVVDQIERGDRVETITIDEK